MRDIERYWQTHNKKVTFTLRSRLILIIGIVAFGSVVAGSGIAYLLELMFPVMKKIPMSVQLWSLAFIIAAVAAQFISKIVCDPIKELLSGMERVADGNFDVQLETKSSAKELQEMIAGFNMMTTELRSTEILQTDFVSNVSHEIKTPVNAIEGYVTLLQGTENIDEIESEYIEKILFNTRRLSSLVNNTLLLSKVENQSIQTRKEKYRLDEQIRTVIVDQEAAWTEKNIEFDVSLLTVEYLGDERIMYHVWSNLIGNAVKFSPQGGEIKIKLFKNGKDVVFSVADKGPGIDENAAQHIFDKFYQGETSHKLDGNGLGLALVKRITDMVGGTVTAENLPGGGCRFEVIFPENNI